MATATSYEIHSRSESVEFWSDWRLPFEPKGVKLEARAALRDAIRLLVLKSHHRLTATYDSSIRSLVDLENVLFYNVGTSTFSQLATRGLHAVRSYDAPHLSPTGRQYAHCQRYSIEPVYPHAQSGAALAFPLPPKPGGLRPHEVWWTASKARVTELVEIRGRFHLTVEVPASTRWNLAAIMKPLMDGIISALHPVRETDVVAIERLSTETGWTVAEIRRRLQQPAAPLLGHRTVLRSYRQFVKWDPADDLCNGFSLIPSQSADQCRVWIRPTDARVPE